jgi:hypothetical protein
MLTQPEWESVRQLLDQWGSEERMLHKERLLQEVRQCLDSVIRRVMLEGLLTCATICDKIASNYEHDTLARHAVQQVSTRIKDRFKELRS